MKTKRILIAVICVLALAVVALIVTLIVINHNTNLGNAIIESSIVSLAPDLHGIEENTSNGKATPVDSTEVTPEPSINLTRENCDFRNAKWGDSVNTVKEYAYDLDFLDEAKDGNITTIVSEGLVCGFDAYIGYQFDNDSLFIGSYLFNIGTTVGGRYILAYDTVKEELTKKYGDPFNDAITALTDQSLIDYAGPAQALEYGYVAYNSQWETDTSDIQLGMYALNYEIQFALIYTDKTYESSEDNGL